jgi:hypothetical protein
VQRVVWFELETSAVGLALRQVCNQRSHFSVAAPPQRRPENHNVRDLTTERSAFESIM